LGLQDALAIALKVLVEPRVIFITLAMLLTWAALRFVGSVYRKRPRVNRRPSAAAAEPPAAKVGGGAARAEPSDDDLIE
jgi:hypothetical protein